MQIDLREFVEVDDATTFEDGVVKNVLVLGSTSKNRRKYSPEAMKKASPLYEGVAVYVDHPTKADKERKGRTVEDRFGVLNGIKFVEQNGGQLRGDLTYLTTHTASPKIAEDWKRGLNFFGLSHLADGSGVTGKDGVTLVESIDRVIEVDLVTNPATAVSLREQEEGAEPAESMEHEAASQQADEHADVALENGVLAIIRNPDMSKEEMAAKVAELFKAHLSVHEEKEEAPKAEQVADPLAERLDKIEAENKQLAEQMANIKKRKYLPGGDRTPVTVAEQATSDADAYPTQGTAADKATWLRRRDRR